MSKPFDLAAFNAVISPSAQGVSPFDDAFSPYQSQKLPEPPPPPPPGDVAAGFKTALGQTPALAKGVVGAIGGALEQFFGEGGISTGLKNWGIEGYQTGMQELTEKYSQPNHDVTVAWEKAKEGDVGALVDFVQYAFGYGLAQIGESAAMALAGSILGGMAGGAAAPATAVAGAAAGVVKKGAIKSLAERWVTNAVAETVAKSGGKIGVKAAAKQLGARWGSTAGLAAFGITQELGSIYPEAELHAAAEGRKLTAGEVAKAWGMGIVAGLTETAADRFQLDAMLGRSGAMRAAFGKMGAIKRGAIGGLVGTAVESGTELLQTGMEQIGAGKPLFSPEANREYINAAAMAAVPGLGGGVVGGVMSRQRAPQTPPPSGPLTDGEIVTEIGRASSVDEAIAIAGALTETGAPMTEAQLLSERALMSKAAEEAQTFLRDRDWAALEAAQAAQTGEEVSQAFDARERRLGAVEEAQRGVEQEGMIAARGEQALEQELAAAKAAGMEQPAGPTAMGLAMETPGKLKAPPKSTQANGSVLEQAGANAAPLQAAPAAPAAPATPAAPDDVVFSREREPGVQSLQAPGKPGASGYWTAAPGVENDAAAVEGLNRALAVEAQGRGAPAPTGWQQVDVGTLPVDDTPLPGSPVGAMARSQESVRLAQNIAGLFGKRVVPIRNLDAKPGDFMGGTVVGGDTERVFLNVDSPDASPVTIVGHETYHQMEVDAPDLAVGVRRAIGLEGKQAIDAGHPLVAFYRYYEGGANLTDDQVVAELGKPEVLERMKREVAADFFGNRAGEYTTLKTIFKAVGDSKDKGLIYKVASYIVQAIDAILRRVKTQKFEVSDQLVSKLVKDLEGAKQVARDAMAEYAKRQGMTKMQAEAAMREAMVERAKAAAQPKPRLDKNRIPILSKQRVEWKKGPMGSGAVVDGQRLLVRRVVMGDLSYQYQAIVAGAAAGTAKTEAAAKALAEQRINALSQSKQRKGAKQFSFFTTPEQMRSVGLQEGVEALLATELIHGPAPEKVGGIPAIVNFLEQRSVAALGRTLDLTVEADRDIAAALMAVEANEAYRRRGHAGEWYDATIRTLMRYAALKHPDLAADPNMRTAFTLAMAITSQGQDVFANIRFAEQQYQAFRDTGRFPETGWGTSKSQMTSSFQLINRMLDAGFDMSTLRQFLATPFYAGELKKLGFTIAEVNDELVLGSSILGPKVGFGFFSNLNGNFEPVTMDMWFMRLIGRLTGSLKAYDVEKIEHQFDRLKNAIANESPTSEDGKPQLTTADVDADVALLDGSEDDVAEYVEAVVRAHEKHYSKHKAEYQSGERVQSEMVLAAKSLRQSFKASVDAPSSGGERQRLRDVVRRAVDKTEKLTGKRLPPAALQALVWYPEQRLYERLGAKLRVTEQDYATGMYDILKKEGYTDEQLAAAKRGSVETRSGDGEAVTRTTRESREAARRPVPLEAGARSAVAVAIAERINKVEPSAIYFEVAPSPTDAALTQAWNELPVRVRTRISDKVAQQIIPKIARAVGAVVRMRPQYGGWMGATNPSFTLDFLGNKNDFIPFTGLLGYALSQQAMVTVSHQPFTDATEMGAVTIDLPDGTAKTVEATYRKLWNGVVHNGEKIVVGHTTVENQMAILNTSPLSTEAFAQLIHDALDGKMEVHKDRVFARFLEDKDYDYGSARKKGAPARRPSLQGDASNLHAEVGQLLRAELAAVPAAARRLAKSGQRSGSGSVEAARGWSSRPAQAQAAEVTGIHYGRERTPVLSGSKYGTGIRGAEAARLAQATDPRIKRRIYFYVADGETLPRPEANLGLHTYTQKFTNLYDVSKVDTRFPSGLDANGFESAVLDLGYDGYVNRARGMLVVLDADVPVEYLGERTAASRTVADLTPPVLSLSTERVQAVLDGKDNRPRIGLSVKTPPAFLAAGFQQRPLTISRSVIEKLGSGAQGQRAALTAAEIADLPAGMWNPIAIFDFDRRGDRDTANVLFMRGDEMWLAGVVRDLNVGSYEVNELLTAFAPDVTPARLAGLNRDMTGRIRYVDRERVFALPARIRDYSPALTQAARNPATSVATPARIINQRWPEVDPPVMSKSEQRAARFKPPTKTVTAYKLFRMKKDGKLYPLFIGAKEATPIGEWAVAKFTPTKGYAPRPGWHAGTLPFAPHLRSKNGKITAGRVWAEVEMPADVDWQEQADASPSRDIRDRVPANGVYRFRTNKMQGGAWLIGGALRIKKVLSDAEVAKILTRAGELDQIDAEMRGDGTLAKSKSRDTSFEKWSRGIKLSEVVEDASPKAKPAFKTGKPFVAAVYHGSPNEFYEFDNNRLGQTTGASSATMGHFAAGTRSTSESYQGLGGEFEFDTDMLTGDIRWDSGEPELILSIEKPRWIEYQDHDPDRVLADFPASGLTESDIEMLREFQSIKDDIVAHETDMADGGEGIPSWSPIMLPSDESIVEQAVEQGYLKLPQVYYAGVNFGEMFNDILFTLQKEEDGSWVVSKNRSPVSTAKNRREAEAIANELLQKEIELRENQTVGATLHELYLRSSNPYVHDYRGKPYREKSYASVISKAKKAGHDAVVLMNTFDGGDKDNIFVFFDPNQVKLRDNDTFSTKTADLRKSAQRAAEGLPLFSKQRDAALANPNFRRWSNEAPVVLATESLDYKFETGEPFVAQTYHGTNASEFVDLPGGTRRENAVDFTAFSLDEGGMMTGADSAAMGIFSTSEPDVASSYAQNIGMGRSLGLALGGAKSYIDVTPEIQALDAEMRELRRKSTLAWDDGLMRLRASKHAEVVANPDFKEFIQKDIFKGTHMPPGGIEGVAWMQDLYRKYNGDPVYRRGLTADDKEVVYIQMLDVWLRRGEADWTAVPEFEEYHKAELALRETEEKLSELINAQLQLSMPQRIMPLWVKMSNPKVYNAEGKSPAEFAISEKIASAKREGHDGVVFQNIMDPSPPSTHFVAFKSEQLKSVFNETFDDTGELSKSAQRTPEFRRWFGDSKVVDESGEPEVQYHSTVYDFSEFNEYGTLGAHFGTRPAALERLNDIGARREAKDRVPDSRIPLGSNVMPVYLRIEKPLRLKDVGNWADALSIALRLRVMFGLSKSTRQQMIELAETLEESQTLYERTELTGDEGFVDQEGNPIPAPDWATPWTLSPENMDALVEIRQALESEGFDGIVYKNEVEDAGVDSYIVFRSDQVKSAIGNRGTFDPTNPDITKSAPRISIGDLTPEQQATAERVGAIVEPVTWQQRWDTFKQDLGMRIQQGVFDQFAPIAKLDYEAYQLARLSKGSDGTLEASVLYGRPFMQDGVPNVDINDRGFADVIATLADDTDRFFWWVAAQRARQLKAQGKENLFSDADITAFETLNLPDAKHPDRRQKFSAALARLNEFNEAMLKIARDSELIDDDAYTLFKDQPYVPFYRVMEDEGGVRGPGFGKGLVNQYAWKKLKGGTEVLNQDLLSNLLQNWAHLLSASAKNRAAVATAVAAIPLGVIEQVPSGTPKAVRMRVQGKEQHFIIHDPHLHAAIGAITYATPGWFKPFSTVKRALTIGVTANPAFKIRNLIRDSVQSIATGQLDPNPIKNVMQGWKAASPKSQTYASMLASGGMIRYGASHEGERSSAVRLAGKKRIDPATILDESGWAALQRKLTALYDAYEELSDKSENINRNALYEQLVAKGYSHREASFMARDLMDFSMGGMWPVVRFLAQSVPFLNARLQGLYKLSKSAKDDPVRVGYTVGAVILASMVPLLMYGDDDDWKRREDWDRDNYWWFKIGDQAYRIPKPFEIGAIGTLAERTWELAFSKEMSGARYGRRIVDTIAEQFAMNPTPQIIKPMVDLYANRDAFTGRAIESMGMERKLPEDRARAGTSTIALALGQLGLPNPAQLANARYEALSPVQIDHLIRAYFGWLGSVTVAAVDYGLRPMTDRGPRPEMKLKDVFIAGGFVETLPPNSSRYVSQMYEQARQAEQYYASYRDALKYGDRERAAEIMSENRDKLVQYQRLKGYAEGVSQLSEQTRRIEASRSLSPETKRKMIDALEQRKHELARRAPVQ